MKPSKADRVCGEAADGHQAIEQAQRLMPDVVVLDFDMPGINGVEAARSISELLPGVPILLNTLYDRNIVQAEALKHGVSSMIPKSDIPALIAAIKSFAESVRTSKTVPS